MTRTAAARGWLVERKPLSDQLDVLDAPFRVAKEQGVSVSIRSSVYRTFDFDNLRFGVGQARRGWLEKRDALNTCGLRALKPLLRHTM